MYCITYRWPRDFSILELNCSLRNCIRKPVLSQSGHDDNVFLNSLAQQAIQEEIARLNIMPENVCSYQKGNGCDAQFKMVL